MRRPLLFAGLAVVTAVGAVSILAASPAMAHPLGNFTHNTYVGLTVTPDSIAVDHVLDLAEIPTYQLQSEMDTDGNGKVSGGEAAAWGRARCAAAAVDITATTDAGALTWTVGNATVTFPAGQAGLPTTRLECGLRADAIGVTSVDVDVAIERGRVGWHEVTAVGAGVDLTADVPNATSSARLTAYPVDVAPADVSTARLSWGTTAPAADAPSGADQEGATRPVATSAVTSILPLGLDSAALAFTDLVGRQDVTFGFALLAIVISLALGGVHALAPGHGKTLMAASLVGTAGRRRDAVVLGATVTTAHTAGVLVLALVLSISSTIAAESAYPWLGMASAVIAVGVGMSLFRQARRGGGALHGHPHPHGHQHDHGDHDHDHHGHDHHGHDHGDHDHGHHDQPVSAGHASVVTAAPAIAPMLAPVIAPAASPRSRPATRRVIALGMAGGLVPSPSAVVVLLAGFALGRSWFALLLVVAYGLGMALTLCLTGVVLIRAGALSRRVASGNVVPRPVAAILNRLPLIAATVVVGAGLWLGVRSFLSM